MHTIGVDGGDHRLGCVRADEASVRRIVWLGWGVVEVLLAVFYSGRGTRVGHRIRGPRRGERLELRARWGRWEFTRRRPGPGTASGGERRSVVCHAQRVFDIRQEEINIRALRREVWRLFVAGRRWENV